MALISLAPAGCRTRPIEEAVSALEREARARCTHEARCRRGDDAAIELCVAQWLAWRRSFPWSLEEAIADGRVRVDAARLESCLEAWRSADCNGPAPSCDFLSGDVPRGGACFGAECQRGTVCTGTRIAGCPGVCGEPPAPREEGEACGLSNECRAGLVCRPLREGDPRTCVPPGRSGEPCLDDWTCARGLFCTLLGQRCAPRVGLGSQCGNTFACIDGLACLDGTCVPPRGVGEACDPTHDFSDCAMGLACEPATATCELPSPREGRPCDTYRDCDGGSDLLGLICDGGRCRRPGGRGAACTPDALSLRNPCAPSLTCSTVTRTCELICD